MGKAVVISLISCTRPKIHVIFYQLLVDNRHILFTIEHTQTSDSIPISLSVLHDPENMGWNCVPNMFTRRDMHISGLEADILEFPLLVRLCSVLDCLFG